MMNNILEYKGYHARIVFDAESVSVRGKIEGINDLVDFESDDLRSIEDEFHSAVDDYLDFCREVGKEPDKEYKGTFNVRISPELHKKSAFEAEKRGISLNQFVALSIENEINNYHVREKETITIVMPPQALKGYIPFLSDGNYPVAKFENEGTMIECKKLTTKLPHFA